eukprot:CAMPEP_0172298140 /NCGR_PEP_ID=MMETSP1058-20130122/920_1 /TAXON_ID=83371 /ORGANISM="Detonula confervacea, Strain CCMP 353" /LENGTH=599 /DNA_ID=CAMNT_0013007383 /DNA_START=32 /DNA_END=1831 /DNA_ORIENTATION=+
MVATRKRKSTRTPAKSKKAKAEEEEKQHPEEETPTKDEHAAAAEALKALSKGGDVALETLVNGSANGVNPTAKSCEDGDFGTETESLTNDVVDSSDEVRTEKEGHVSLEEFQPSMDGAATCEAATPSKPTPAEAVAVPGSGAADLTSISMVTPLAQPGVPNHTTVTAVIAAEATIEEKGQVSSLYVGRVIGKGGEMIRDLQARSGCKIDVDQNVPHDAPRIITYRGTRSTIDFAKRLVAILCTENGKDADLPLGQAVMKKVQVPGAVIGKIIGRGGEMIRKLQSESHAKIQVDHSSGMDPNHRQVTITGMKESVIKAEEMILFLCANPAVDSMDALQMLVRDKAHGGRVWGSGPPYPNFPNQGQGMPLDGLMGSGTRGTGSFRHTSVGYNGYSSQQTSENRYGPSGSGGANAVGLIETDMFPCAKMYMGRVIGQKGMTINDLQKRSGCDIQINQNVPTGQDCQVSIKGSRQGIEMAKQMLQEIIELGPNHPYAGGHGQFGNIQGGQQSYQQQSYRYADQGYQPQVYSHRQYALPQQQFGGQPVYQQQPQQGHQYGVQLDAHIPVGQASPWRAASAADGQIYYYNQMTQETQWDRPSGMP